MRRFVIPMLCAALAVGAVGCGAKNAPQAGSSAVEITGEAPTAADSEADENGAEDGTQAADVTEAQGPDAENTEAVETAEAPDGAGTETDAEESAAVEALPPYEYHGEDEGEAAITEYMLNDSGYFLLEGGTFIPAFRIFRTEWVDDETAKVYGNFWVLGYTKQDQTLFCESGGSAAGIFTLKYDGEGCSVESFEVARDGADYDKDLEKFSNGDASLLEEYRTSGDLMSDPMKSDRERYLFTYVTENDLDIDSYQDYGHDAVKLPESLPQARN